MTIAQVLAQVDELTPNAYTAAEKLRWLTEAEGFIIRDILAPREAETPLPVYDAKTDTALPLRAEEPYDVLYRYYIEMQIHYANDETTRANNARAQWNNAFLAYQNHTLRKRRTAGTVGALRVC